MINKHFVLSIVSREGQYYYLSGKLFKYHKNRYFYWMNKYDSNWQPIVGGFLEHEIDNIIIVKNEEEAQKIIEQMKEKLK